MKIYADVLFFINFIMDYFLIAVTAKFFSLNVKLWRKLAAACLGGAFALCFFAVDLGYINSFVASLFSGFCMSATVFFPCKFKDLVKKTAAFYLFSMLVAGASFFVMNISGGGVIKNGVFYAKTPTVVFGAISVYVVVSLFGAAVKRISSKKFSGTVLEFRGKSVSLTGIVDTGNGLTEPISKKPVMIIGEDALKKLVAKECTCANISEWVESERLRTIPYKTIDSEGVLVGILLDRAYIDGRRVDGAVAAVSEKKLNYQVILHAGM